MAEQQELAQQTEPLKKGRKVKYQDSVDQHVISNASRAQLKSLSLMGIMIVVMITRRGLLKVPRRKATKEARQRLRNRSVGTRTRIPQRRTYSVRACVVNSGVDCCFI